MPMAPALRSIPVTAALLALASGALVAQVAPGTQAPSVADGVDYLVYDRSGAPATLGAILRAASGSEVLLVGEEHDDMVGHALEAIMLESLIAELDGTGAEPGRTVVLSLEMFERDVQYVLDEYLAGLISEDQFLRSARPWDDYEARYRPLVEAARAYGGPVVAANAPRRYVNRVTREGPASLDALSGLAKRYLPPLPFPGPSERYRAQWDALMSAAMADAPAVADSTAAPGHRAAPAEGADPQATARHEVASNAIHAQALWDAAMGHAITTALVEHLGALVVHFAGSFHVAHGTGIPERIEDYRPGTRVTTVVMTKADDIGAWSAEEHGDQADFVVLTKKPAAEEGGGS